jgi:hypothetical protein
MMRKQYLRILCVLICVTGFGVATQGQTVDRLDVKIPYEFVVGGKTLPAGYYSVRRVLESSGRVLLLSNVENHASALLVAIQFECGPVDKVYVSFEQVGDQHFLSMIQTADHLFTIPVSRKAIMEAAAKSQSDSSASGSMAGNG